MPIALSPFEQQLFQTSDPAAARVNFGAAGWGTRAGAGVDAAQAQLYEVGEMVGLPVSAARDLNANAAEYNRARAIRDTGAPARLRDIDGLGSLAKGAAGLVVDSAPQLAASVAAGFATGGMGLIPRAAAVSASQYPFAVGDILQNQREEAGRTNAEAALGLAVPYVAADMLGLDGMIAAGRAGRVANRGLDAMQGWKGAAARGAVNTGVTSLGEGAGETLQEFANQAGRISVNPNQTMFNADANERYVESFGGGALLGGSVRAPLGSWGRSATWHEDQAKAQTETQRAAALESGSQADLLSSRPDYNLQSYGQADGPLFNQQSEAPTPQHYADPRQMNLMSGVNEFVNGQPVELTSDELRGNRIPFVPTPVDMTGGLSLRNDGPMGNEIDYTPEQRQIASNFGLVNDGGPQGDFFGGGGVSVPTQARPDFELSMQDGRQGELFNQQPTQDAPTAPTEPVIGRSDQRGVTGQLPFAGKMSPKAQVLMPLIESLEREGHLDEGSAVQATTLVATSKFAAAKKIVDNALKEKAAADSILAKAQSVYSKNQPVTQPAQTAGVAVQGAEGSQPTPVAPTPKPEEIIAIGPQRGKGGVVTVKVGSKAVSVKPLHYNRLKALLGLDASGLPTGDRQTLEQVAQSEGLTGKQARSTIAHSLSLFGLNEEKINAILDYGTSWMQGASPEEASDGTSRANPTPHINHDVAAFAQSNEDGNTGMRIEPTMAAAAKGSPIVNRDNYSRPDGRGGVVTRVEDKLARKQADETLAANGKGDAREVYDPAKDPTRAKREALVLEKARAEMAVLKRSPQHFKMVAGDWNNLKSNGIPSFDKLDVVAQYAWLNGLMDLQKEGIYDERHANELQRGIERSYEQTQNVDGQLGSVHEEGKGGTSGPTRSGTPTKPAEAQVQEADQITEGREAGRLSDAERVQSLRDEIDQYEQLLACIAR